MTDSFENLLLKRSAFLLPFQPLSDVRVEVLHTMIAKGHE